MRTNGTVRAALNGQRNSRAVKPSNLPLPAAWTEEQIEEMRDGAILEYGSMTRPELLRFHKGRLCLFDVEKGLRPCTLLESVRWAIRQDEGPGSGDCCSEVGAHTRWLRMIAKAL